jgi:hypothetical protein
MEIIFQKPSNIKFIIAQEDCLKASLTLRRAASCNVHFVFSNIVKNFENPKVLLIILFCFQQRDPTTSLSREERLGFFKSF